MPPARFTVTTPEGIQHRHRGATAHGETIAITDGNGNTTTYSLRQRRSPDRDDASRKARSTSAPRTTYDRAGLKTETRRPPTAPSTRFDVRRRQSAGDAAPSIPTIPRLTPTASTSPPVYRYDGQGRMVLTVTDANGTATVTQYDRNGQVTSITVDPTSYVDTDGTPVTNPAGLNLVTAYTYDAAGHTLTVTEGRGHARGPHHRVPSTMPSAGGRHEIKDPVEQCHRLRGP
ncbi:MAG: RHS repeat protein [Candidatus Moduliflexus flocculans]|nr:RHS repeat protein [Candidatus Moduliflexus flocculans]